MGWGEVIKHKSNSYNDCDIYLKTLILVFLISKSEVIVYDEHFLKASVTEMFVFRSGYIILR